MNFMRMKKERRCRKRQASLLGVKCIVDRPWYLGR